MPQFISEGAEDTLEDPTEGTMAELVVRVDAAAVATTEEWTQAHGGSVVESLDHGLLEIELPEVRLSALTELAYVRAIERTDESITPLDQGN